MPQRFHRLLGFLAFGLVLLGSQLVVACGSDDLASAADADAGERGDMDSSPAVDASAQDAGMPVPAPPGVSELWLGSARGNELSAGSFTDDATSCFDNLDNDSDDNMVADGVDCDDPECQGLPSCCANEAACVAAPTLVVETDFDGCSDAICGEDFTIFGGPFEPVIDSGSLALQGDFVYDTGLYGGEALNLRHQRIDVEVQFRLGECAGCVETAAVALTAQETLTESTFIQPLVGLRALATVNEVQLIIHDRVVATYLADDVSVPWKLSVRPDGQVWVQHGTLADRHEFVPTADAHIALYGHSTNPGVDRVGARVDGLRVERYETDRVDAWTPARSLELPGGRVSVARLNEVDYLAINDAVADGPHSVRFHLASDGSVLNWVFRSAWDATDYSVAQLGGVIYVYAMDSSGSLVRGAVDLELSEVAEPELELTPSDLGWTRMGSPAVIQAAGNRILVAEVDGALGAAFLTDDGWVALSSLPALTPGAREPSLVTHNEVYWLHYSVQSGTRQRVRAMVSDQMFHWRDLGDALRGSGERDSVDRFSVASPALVSDGDSLRMYMSADDHVLRRLAVAERFSPAGRSR